MYFRNGNYIPLVFALLPLKTDECYNKMRDLLIDACTTRNFTFQPEVVHIDFEYAMHSAVTNKFPNATISLLDEGYSGNASCHKT